MGCTSGLNLATDLGPVLALLYQGISSKTFILRFNLQFLFLENFPFYIASAATAASMIKPNLALNCLFVAARKRNLFKLLKLACSKVIQKIFRKPVANNLGL